MNNKYICRVMALLSVAVLSSPMRAGTEVQPDSLPHYLELAARSNPQLQADLALYKASVEKLPQAGAYPDPELELGVFPKPMHTLMGKQVADLTLMQMFPWFGVRQAARAEAEQMAKMAYEQFRERRDNIWYQVKSQWYELCGLGERYKAVQSHIDLLHQLEQLALGRFSAAGVQTAGSSSASPPRSVWQSASTSPASSTDMGGMPGMSGGMRGVSSAPMTSGANAMPQMSGSGAMSMSSGSMADVVRIQLERAELEHELLDLLSRRRAAEAKFNTLLNRSVESSVALADTLERRILPDRAAGLLDSLLENNPMVAMLKSEARAYRAKARMDRLMSYPMIGLGLQYSMVAPYDKPILGNHGNGHDMLMPMIKVSLPIFRGKYKAQQRENKLYYQASQLKEAELHNQLRAEYLNLRLRLEESARKSDLYARQYALSQSLSRIVIQELVAGRQGIADVIAQERQLVDYRLKAIEAVVAYNTYVAALEKLLSISF